MTTPAKALAEIKIFLADFRLEVSDVDLSSEQARCLYRRFHALLLWDVVVDRDEFSPTIRLYTREHLADLATGYFLTLASCYKASRLCLRGSIENAIRVLTASAGYDILKINTVWELVEACKEKWAVDSLRLSILSNIYSIYTDLCNTVHSTSIDYMSLRVPFEKLFDYEKAAFLENANIFDSTMRLLGEAFFLEFHDHLNLIDFKNADYIRDSVEKQIKKAVIAT